MKKKYKIYFEIYGKKMKVDVYADNEAIAKQTVKDKLIIHKVEQPKYGYNDIADTFGKIMDILK